MMATHIKSADLAIVEFDDWIRRCCENPVEAAIGMLQYVSQQTDTIMVQWLLGQFVNHNPNQSIFKHPFVKDLYDHISAAAALADVYYAEYPSGVIY